MPEIAALKDSIEVLSGGAGGIATNSRFRVEVLPPPPPPPLVFLGRLHDRSAVASGRTIHNLENPGFIPHPTTESSPRYAARLCVRVVRSTLAETEWAMYIFRRVQL